MTRSYAGPRNVTSKLLESHLLGGELEPGAELALRVDQTLTQDATGTLVMLELEAMGLDYVATELSAQYVDHNLVQADHRNADGSYVRSTPSWRNVAPASEKARPSP